MGNSALLFDGTSGQRVDYGNILNIDATTSFEIEVMARSSAQGVLKVLAAKRANLGAGTAGWQFVFSAANTLNVRIGDGTNDVQLNVAGVQWLDGKPRRFGIQVDRIVQRIRLYVNGSLVGTSGDISGVGSLATAISLQLGANNAANSWIGDLDDFRFWLGVRTESEIQETMHRELTGAEAATTEIYTKFSEGSGTSAADSSGNGRTGTLMGDTLPAWTTIPWYQGPIAASLPTLTAAMTGTHSAAVLAATLPKLEAALFGPGRWVFSGPESRREADLGWGSPISRRRP